MITMTRVLEHGRRLPMSAYAVQAVREWKQIPSVVLTGGFIADYNSTTVSAPGHRYRQ
jgi:hypothetical protein